jgi:4-diphosphocytidyl-2-C-methyl-D-erythritol kinase
MSVRVFAPAKINLTLEVGRPGADGYHPLQSAVMFADVGDWIEAAPGGKLSLAISGPFATSLDSERDNLVLRAARLLGDGRGASLRLEKNLPVASGIGGGSSDAAAALLALNELWALDRGEADLVQMAAQLGADAPVCVRRRSAWISGTGHTMTAMRTPILDAVLVNPGAPLSTAAVYRRFDDMGLGERFRPQGDADFADASDAVAAVLLRGNDLERVAISLMPEIHQVLSVLRSDPRALCASLSGSGATCFALTRGPGDAAALADDLGSRHPGWWVRAVRLGAA